MPEWNVVQATLRQVSMRLSGSVLFLGCSCGVSLLVLVDLAWLRNEVASRAYNVIYIAHI